MTLRISKRGRLIVICAAMLMLIFTILVSGKIYAFAGYTLLDFTPVQEEPEPFIVEDMEDTPMWVTSMQVTYYDGPSTEYNKLGSLWPFKKVIVNGVASTGWYRFNTADVTVAYVSNDCLTTQNPTYMLISLGIQFILVIFILGHLIYIDKTYI